MKDKVDTETLYYTKKTPNIKVLYFIVGNRASHASLSSF